jgi:hypothetical protein
MNNAGELCLAGVFAFKVNLAKAIYSGLRYMLSSCRSTGVMSFNSKSM